MNSDNIYNLEPQDVETQETPVKENSQHDTREGIKSLNEENKNTFETKINADRDPNDNKIHVGANILYLSLVGGVFFILTAIFLFFPRSKYSELEKRELAEFPNPKNLVSDPEKYTDDVSFWFSDTEPFRDFFMTMSMGIRDFFRFRTSNDEEAFSFKPNLENTAEDIEEDKIPEAQGNPLADENAKVANAGIIVVGSGPKVRALMAFGGTEKSCQPYIDALNDYIAAFPNQNIYAAVIPNATAFYLPKKAEKASKPQDVPLNWLKANLNPKVKYVDVYGHLAGHTTEDIYLRTDHHWAPLGAYYAAKALAAVAGVPFKDLSHYDKHVVHDYVGSMYGYSKDIAVKNAPEDFVYYTPKNAGEQTTYITYSTNKDYQVTSESAPYAGNFFHSYPDGSGGAYCTFMGGDSHIVKVRTNANNGRRILIIKDSFGNPIPGYLFYSFEEVHVIDFRYFKKNLKDYVANNKITDIVLAFNIFSTCSVTSMGKIRNFITQPNGIGKVSSDNSQKSSSSDKEKKADTKPKESSKKSDVAPQKEKATSGKSESEPVSKNENNSTTE